MEKNTTASLQEFTLRLARLEEELAALRGEFAAWQASAADAPAVEAVDIDIDVLDIPDAVAAAAVAAPVQQELAEAPAQEPSPAEPVVEPEVVEEIVAEPAAAPAEPAAAPAEPEEDMPLFAEEAPAPAPAKGRKGREADGDYAWKTARPGMPVKNLRSAISLFDRALFINTLFKEDYALYDRTIGDLNNLATLDEAVDYISARFPEWNLGSDVVYSFMMALRKKLG